MATGTLEPAIFDFCPWDFYLWNRFRRLQPMIKSSDSEVPYMKIIPPHAFVQDLQRTNSYKGGFHVQISVKHFKPKEVTVRIVGDTIQVEGEHEEQEDEFGIVSRRFVRTYPLPTGCDARDVVSNLSSDGILTIEAPPKKKSDENSNDRNERIIHIADTGEPIEDINKILHEEDTCRIA